MAQSHNGVPVSDPARTSKIAVHIVIGAQKLRRRSGDISSSSKAPEDWRIPRRFAYFKHHRTTHRVLECGGPPPLFPEAYQTVPMLTGTAIAHSTTDHSGSSLRNSFRTFSTLMARTPVISFKITNRSPCGRQISSSVSAHRTTHGNPTAAARCVMPES